MARQLIPQTPLRTLVALASVALLGCAGGTTPAANSSAADEVSASWSKAFNAGDASALAALYAEDGHSMPPGSGAVTGRGNIEAYWKADLAGGGAVTTLKPADSVAQGDLLHVDGTYDVKSKAGLTLASGQYQQLWKRTDGQWRIQHEIWRLDPTMQRDPMMAEALESTWTEAYNKGDAEALTKLYDADAILTMAPSNSVEGSEGIGMFWKADFGSGKPKTTLTLRDAYVSGDLAHLEGEYEVADKGKTVKGHYVQLWMQENNEWRIHREMWWQ